MISKILKTKTEKQQNIQLFYMYHQLYVPLAGNTSNKKKKRKILK
jgi:hypothetical protein